MAPASLSLYKAEHPELSGREMNGQSLHMLIAEPEQASCPDTIALSTLEWFAVESHQPLFLQIILSISTYCVQGTRGQGTLYKAIFPRCLGGGTEYLSTRSPGPWGA